MENLGDLSKLIDQLREEFEDELGTHSFTKRIERLFKDIDMEISGVDINLEFMIQDIVDIKEKISKIEDELNAITI